MNHTCTVTRAKHVHTITPYTKQIHISLYISYAHDSKTFDELDKLTNAKELGLSNINTVIYNVVSK